MSKEPDDTVVRMDHVKVFLGWYESRTKLYRFPGDEVMWLNGFKDLTLGELRRGMRAYERFETKPAMTPPQFWQLCKGTTNERAVLEFRKMRDRIKQGKMKIADAYKPKRTGESPGKPGTSHD